MICRVLRIAPSPFYAHLAVERDPDLASYRAKRDAALRPEIKRVWEDNRSVYGARKLWHATKREKFDIARYTVERLMSDLGIEGVRRSKKVKTTWPPLGRFALLIACRVIDVLEQALYEMRP